jgi:hypothetical protein
LLLNSAKNLSSELILYGTSGCHLCEEALDIIVPVALAMGLAVREIDIAGDEALEHAYGLRIPVLAVKGGELGWPFTTDEVSAFLAPYKD